MYVSNYAGHCTYPYLLIVGGGVYSEGSLYPIPNQAWSFESRIFPHKSYTKKPLEVRMGKGKAAVEGWVAVVRPATMLFEISGVSERLAREALALAAAKLPIKTRLIKR